MTPDSGTGTTASKGTIRVLQLYPREMNIYGDWGNALVLQQRLKWHGYTPELLEYNVGDEFPEGVDIILGGGGADIAFGGDCLDLIMGGPGDDLISGENGNDYIAGDAGVDTAYGGPGLNYCATELRVPSFAQHAYEYFAEPSGVGYTGYDCDLTERLY